MKRSRARVSLAVLATVLALVISLDSTPSDTSVPAPYQQPVPQEDAAVLQDLARWTVTGSRSTPHGFQAIRTEDFEAAMTSDPHEISLFEPDTLGHDPEARRRFLHSLPYGTAIAVAAERHEVDGLLMAAIVAVESGFTPEAVSPKGATGLMQVRPSVGRAYGAGDLFDPYANVDVGSRYFRSLMKDYKGDLELTLAAYNAGPAAVARYGGVPPYRETRAYVRKVLARYEEYSQRADRANRAKEARPGARAARLM
jgi:Transglycosylase SLT domain